MRKILSSLTEFFGYFPFKTLRYLHAISLSVWRLANFIKSENIQRIWLRPLLLVFGLGLISSLQAQQEQQYTQFMYNKLSINPGYAGSKDAPCLTAVVRSQWLGLEGAPQTQLLSYNMPLLNKRIGVGLNLVRHSISIYKRFTAEATYAYRIRVGRGTLGFGVQGSVRAISANYTDDRLIAGQDISLDNSIPDSDQNKLVGNFGAGLYYHTPKYYIGISAPRFLRNNIDFDDVGTVLSREVPHLSIMGGFLFEISENIDIQPQVLIKYAENTPLDADVNLTFVFTKRYMAGLTYRAGGSSVSGAGESLDLLLGGHLIEDLFFGLSYDMTLSDIKNYNSGSVEAVLRYCFGTSEGEDIINPRFF